MQHLTDTRIFTSCACLAQYLNLTHVTAFHLILFPAHLILHPLALASTVSHTQLYPSLWTRATMRALHTVTFDNLSTGPLYNNLHSLQRCFSSELQYCCLFTNACIRSVPSQMLIQTHRNVKHHVTYYLYMTNFHHVTNLLSQPLTICPSYQHQHHNTPHSLSPISSKLQ
jgi:hypothetical protein